MISRGGLHMVAVDVQHFMVAADGNRYEMQETCTYFPYACTSSPVLMITCSKNVGDVCAVITAGGCWWPQIILVLIVLWVQTPTVAVESSLKQ